MGKYYTLLEFSHSPDLHPQELLDRFNAESPVDIPEDRFHHELNPAGGTQGAVLLKRLWDTFRVRRFLKRASRFRLTGTGKLNKHYLHWIQWGI